MRKIAISDIHGCINTFRKLIETINLQKKDELYLLGDYIHRGINGFEVLDYIFKLNNDGYKINSIAGNHENMLIKHVLKSKLRNNKYYDFCCDLPITISKKNYLLVHSIFFLTFKTIPKNAYSMVKEGKIPTSKKQNQIVIDKRTVIHGHTPQSRKIIEDKVNSKSKIIPIDNGCFQKNKSNLGSLCAFDFKNYKLYFQKNIDKLNY